jgi:hypothetical protein
MSSVNNETEQPTSGRKKRAYKNLPLELQDIDRRDISSFICALELDAGNDTEELRAQKIIKNNVEISLANLNADQLRLLCRRLGITGASSAKRDACRALIAKLHTINSSAASRSDDPRSVEKQGTNTLLRQINVIFSSEFIERFQELNDGKTRVDHETKNIPKQFWADATLAYNDFEEMEQVVNTEQLGIQNGVWEDVKKITLDISSTEKIKQTTSDLIDILDVSVNLPATNAKLAVGELLLAHATEGKEGVVREIISKFGWRSFVPVPLQEERDNFHRTEEPLYFDEKLIFVNKANHPILQCLIDEKEFDLADVEVMTPDVFKKRVNLLFRIRRKMKDNMTLSGTHDSDPWNFIDHAMNKIPGGRRLPKVGVLYFYLRCQEFPDVDAAFQIFLDDGLKGSTTDVISETGTMRRRESTESDERSSKRAKDEKQRADAYSAVSSMNNISSLIYDEFQRSNKKLAVETKKLRES